MQDVFEGIINQEGRRIIREALEVWAVAKSQNSMTLNDYQKAAQRTSNTVTFTGKMENGLYGLAGEVGELHDHYKKHLFQMHDLDKEHLKRELGDVLWYVAEMACGLECTLAEIAQINIDKLKARYPDGFEADKSLHRAEGDD
jgi:NTP pyrophosphatase (non-canonical NTP hydrolase)